MAISNKALKKAMVIAGVTSIAGATITPIFQVPMAHAETAINVAKDKKDTAALKQADYSKLDKATADAKKAKIKVTERTTKRSFTSEAEASKFLKEEQARAEKQAADNQKKVDTFNKDFVAYNKAVEPFKGQTPKIDKDGLKVYGDYNESKRGSLDYFKGFNGVVDPETFEKGGYSLVEPIRASDKTEFIGLGKTKVIKSDVKEYENPFQVIRPQKGDKVKATYMTKDKLTGRDVAAILTMTSHVQPGDGSEWRMIFTKNKGALGIGYVKVSGLAYDIQFVDQETNKPLKIYTMFGNVDVDNHQGGDMSFGNIGFLNPKDSGVQVTQNANGVSYFDTTGNLYDEDKDIPFGSFVVAGHGSTFSASFFDKYEENKGKYFASAEYGKQESGAGFYNEMFGEAGAMNMILPPEKPTLTADKVEVSITSGPVKNRVDAEGNILTNEPIKLTDRPNFGLTAKIPEVDSKGAAAKDIKVIDPLEEIFKFESGVVKMNDSKGEDVTADGTLEYVDGTGVVWTPKDGSKYAGKTVYIQLEVSIKPDADLSKYEKDGQLVFPNSVYMTVNGEKVDGNEVVVIPLGETTPIVKKVVVDNWDAVLKDTETTAPEAESTPTPEKDAEEAPKPAATEETPEVETKSETDDKATTDAATVKKGQRFGYVLNTKIDTLNEEGQLIKSFKLVDHLEDALTVDTVQVIDKTTGQDITADFEQSDKVVMTLNPEKLVDYRGHDVEWRIGVHIDENADLSAYKQADGSYLVKNIGAKEQNDKVTDSNNVDVILDKDPEPKPEPKKEEPKKETPEKELPEVEKPLEEAPNTGVTNPLTQFVQWVKSFF